MDSAENLRSSHVPLSKRLGIIRNNLNTKFSLHLQGGSRRVQQTGNKVIGEMVNSFSLFCLCFDTRCTTRVCFWRFWRPKASALEARLTAACPLFWLIHRRFIGDVSEIYRRFPLGSCRLAIYFCTLFTFVSGPASLVLLWLVNSFFSSIWSQGPFVLVRTDEASIGIGTHHAYPFTTHGALHHFCSQ